MGKPAPTPPTPVDPTVVSAAQTASNVATADNQSHLNNGNSYGPNGSVTNTYDPNANQWTQTTTLSPEQQAIYDQGNQAKSTALGIANGQLGNVQSALNTPLTAPGMQTGVQSGPLQMSVGGQDVNQSVRNAINANFGGQMQLLQPKMQQQDEQHNAQLVAQGLNPNDAAWQNDATLYGNQRATLLGQVAANAVNAGNAEQNTLFGQQLNQGEFANTAQGQQFSQGLQNANLNNSAQQSDFSNKAYAQQLPINEFDALMSSGQVGMPTAGNFAQTAIAPTDVTGAYGLQAQQQQQQYQAQMQNYQSGLGGLFNLGSAAMAFM